MRLITHMSDATGTWSPASVYGRVHVTDLQHDAAMAHALVIAIGELQTMSEMLVTIRLRKRADELMRGWGFGED